MDYVKKHQQGGQLKRLKALLKGTDAPIVAKRNSIPNVAPKLIAPGKDVMRNYLTGQPVTPEEYKQHSVGTPLPGQLNHQPQAELKQYQVPSVREGMVQAMNHIDNYGNNQVAGIFTSPVKSAMNLLRPDKYYAGVQNDSDVLKATGAMGMDAANVVGAVKGLGALQEVKYLAPAEELTPKQLMVKKFLESSDVVPSGFGKQPIGESAQFVHTDPSKLQQLLEKLKQDDDYESIVSSGPPKADFVGHMRNTHDVPEEEIVAYRDALRQRNPNISDKNLAFIARRDMQGRLKPDVKYGMPTMDDRFSNVVDGQFINKNKIATDYTPQEKMLASEYTRGYDKLINGRLSQYGDMVTPDLQKAAFGAKQDLETLIKRNKLQEPTTVYRNVTQYRIPAVQGADGIIRRNVLMSDLRKGDTYSPRSFTSTSLVPAASHDFGDIAMDINLPGGGKQSILYPNAMGRSEFPEEKEVLLPSKLRYRVDDVDNVDNATLGPRYKMSVVNPYTTIPLLGGLAYGINKQSQP